MAGEEEVVWDDEVIWDDAPQPAPPKPPPVQPGTPEMYAIIEQARIQGAKDYSERTGNRRTLEPDEAAAALEKWGPLRNVLSAAGGAGEKILNLPGGVYAALGSKDAAAGVEANRENAKLLAAANAIADTRSVLPEFLNRGLRGTGEALATGFIGGPVLFGLEGTNEAAARATEAGKTGFDKATYALAQGAIDTVLGKVFKGAGGKAATVVGKSTAREAVSQAVQNFKQTGKELFGINFASAVNDHFLLGKEEHKITVAKLKDILVDSATGAALLHAAHGVPHVVRSMREAASRPEAAPAAPPAEIPQPIPPAEAARMLAERAPAAQTPPAPPQAKIVAVEPPPPGPPLTREHTLPRELAGAKPRYSYKDKNFEIKFESDVDRAIYTVTNKGKSKGHPGYQAFLENIGLDEGQIRQRGVEIREGIKAQAKDADPGTIIVAKMELPQVRPTASEPIPAPPPAPAQLPMPAEVPPPAAPPAQPPQKAMTPPPGAGRPELANPATAPEARNFVDLARTEREVMEGPRQVKPDWQRNAEAAAIISNPEQRAALQAKLLNRQEAQRISDAETKAAQALINEANLKAVASGNAADILRAQEQLRGFDDTGRDPARALRARWDPLEAPALRIQRMANELLIRPSKKLAGEIAEAEKSQDVKLADALKMQAAQEAAALAKRLQLTPEKMAELAQNPKAWAKHLRQVASAKSDGWDAMYEWWQSGGILSGPETHGRNAISNLAHQTAHFSVFRPLATLWNMVPGVRDAHGPQAGEFKYLVKGIMPGLARAARNSVMTWETELPFFEIEMGRKPLEKVEESGAKIGGDWKIPGTNRTVNMDAAGRVVRVPYRALGASDAATKSLVAQMEVGAQAYRMGKAGGLKGEELSRFIESEMANKNSESWDRAIAIAQGVSFQQHGGKVAAATKAAILKARSVPGVRYVAPFVTTPVNIAETTYKYSPLASAGIGYDLLSGKTRKALDPERLAHQTLAWTLTAALANSWDDNDPWITGSVPAGQRSGGARALAYRGPPPFSIRFRGRWYDYSGAEPFATILAATADVLSRPNDAGRVGALVDSISSQMANKTFFQTIAQIQAIVFGQDPNAQDAEEAREKGFLKIVGGAYPNLLRQAGKAYKAAQGQQMEERGVWGKGDERWDRIVRRMIAGTETQANVNLKYDRWGRPIEYSDGTGWFPFRSKPDVAPHVADQFLNAWNKIAAQPYYPLQPGKTYQSGKQTKYMTDAQYAEYSKLSGELADMRASLIEWDLETPTAEQVEKLKDIFSESNKDARDVLVKKWERAATTPQKAAAQLDTEDARMPTKVRALQESAASASRIAKLTALRNKARSSTKTSRVAQYYDEQLAREIARRDGTIVPP